MQSIAKAKTRPAEKATAKRVATARARISLKVSSRKRKVPALTKSDAEFFAGVGTSKRFSIDFANKLFDVPTKV